MKNSLTRLLTFAILLAGCNGVPAGQQASAPTSLPATETAGPPMAERQLIGHVSFQSIEGYSIEGEGEDGIFIGSPDAEISVLMAFLPNDFFDEQMTPTIIGAEYPEEAVPFDILLSLGFGNIELQPLHPYHYGEFDGYSRRFISSSDFGDPIEGEYLFYKVGDFTFIAMGSVVRVEGNNRWDPHGKAAYEAIINSVEFELAEELT